MWSILPNILFWDIFRFYLNRPADLVWSLPYLVAVVVAFQYRKAYWGRMLFVACIVLFAMFFLRIYLGLGRPTRLDRDDIRLLIRIAGALTHLGLCAAVLSIASVPLAARATEPQGALVDSERPSFSRYEHPLVLVLILIVTLNIFWLVWLYRVVRDLNSGPSRKLPFTASNAVLFMFIPVYNLFWIFYVMGCVCKELARLNEQRTHELFPSRLNPVAVLVLLGLSAGFPILVLLTTLMSFMASSADSGRSPDEYWVMLAAHPIITLMVFAYLQRFIRNIALSSVTEGRIVTATASRM